MAGRLCCDSTASFNTVAMLVFAAPPKVIQRIGAEDQAVSTGALPTVCSGVLFLISVVLLIMTFPLSLAFIVKVRSVHGRTWVWCGVVRW